MPLIRRWTPKGMPLTVTFECPYYEELLPSKNPKGCLPRDFEAHALWQFYGLATAQYQKAKDNFVEESEQSEVFDQQRARQIFEGVANSQGVKPHAMMRFWGVIDRQRAALGLVEILPEEFKIKFWGH